MEQDFFKTADGFGEEPAPVFTEPVPAKEFNLAEAITDYKRNGVLTMIGAAITKVAETVKSFVWRIVDRVLHFAAQALEIAVSKFLVEICAMVIAAVCKALLAKHGKGMDITTGGVFWNGGPAPAGAAPPNQDRPGHQSSMWSGSAFDNGWNRNGSVW